MTSTAMVRLRTDLHRFDLALAVLTVGLSSVLIQASPERFDIGWPEVPAGIGAFAMVLLRRRWALPLLGIALVSAGTFVAIWERPTTLIFAGLVLLATACLRLERWPSIGLGAVVAVSLYLMALIGFLGDGAELGDSDAVIGVVWSALAVGIADAVRSWHRYKEAADAQEQSAVLASEAQVREQVSEQRLSIARELHDLLAHNLSVMNVQTGAALHLLRTNPDQAEISLNYARDAGRSVLDELSDLLSALRHDDDHASPTSLPSITELPSLVETMRSAGLDVEWTRSGSAKALTPAVSLAAYRIVQEALTNAAKHGNGAAELATRWEDDGVSLRIANTVSTTMDPEENAAHRHGLVGMMERASGSGGRFATSDDNGRFVVDAWLPAAPQVTA